MRLKKTRVHVSEVQPRARHMVQAILYILESSGELNATQPFSKEPLSTWRLRIAKCWQERRKIAQLLLYLPSSLADLIFAEHALEKYLFK